MIKINEHKFPQHTIASEKFFGVKKLYLPLSQHTGKPSRPCVAKGDVVNESELVAEAEGLISATVSAPRKGTIKDVNLYGHPVLKKAPAIIIECVDEQKTYSRRRDVESLERETLLEIVRRAGIVGMGGACFPSHVKLTPPKKVDVLIINGCECEPYLSSDYRLMVEKCDEIFKGVELIARILRCREVIFALEDNKPEAVKKCNLYVSTKKYRLPSQRIAVLKSAYPQGGEKQLIYSVARRRVPAGGLPFDVGSLVHNVGTCFAVYEAVYFQKPLIERLVTFAGEALLKPKNLWLKIGTTIQELFDQKVLEFKAEPEKIVYGGPMMGIALDGLSYPVLKGTSGVLFLTGKELDQAQESRCIRCARCVDHCPMGLLPLEYVKRVQRWEFTRLDELYINNCIECGCCSFVCPAKIPLVHYIKIGKKYANNKS